MQNNKHNQKLPHYQLPISTPPQTSNSLRLQTDCGPAFTTSLPSTPTLLTSTGRAWRRPQQLVRPRDASAPRGCSRLSPKRSVSGPCSASMYVSRGDHGDHVQDVVLSLFQSNGAQAKSASLSLSPYCHRTAVPAYRPSFPGQPSYRRSSYSAVVARPGQGTEVAGLAVLGVGEASEGLVLAPCGARYGCVARRSEE